MGHFDITDTFLTTLPSVIATAELFFFLPLTDQFLSIAANCKKAFRIMNSSSISDHWKEKALTFLSFRMMTSNLKIIFFVLLLLVCFGTIYLLIGFFLFGNRHQTIESLFVSKTQLIICAIGTVYGFSRSLLLKSLSKTKGDYPLPSRILHYFALGNSVVREIAFETDCLISPKKIFLKNTRAPVFIAGLSRAGTTLLLEALHSTGSFTSLSYRDMPFITAPYLWNRVSKNFQTKGKEKNERAHGDGLLINHESPEAFEEVFWITFSGDRYIKKQHLDIQEVDPYLVEKYKKYITNIVNRDNDETSFRYLAKNNNNILRIDSIKTAFQDAIILAPFRHPANHSQSLATQHKRFCLQHERDPFSLKYMNWLGHFEFGLNFKPFKLDNAGFHTPNHKPTDVEHWLKYWIYIYEYLINHHAQNIVFINYDKLCEQPELHFEKIEKILQLPARSLQVFSKNIRPAKNYLTEMDKGIILSRHVEEIYESLQDTSL